MLRLLGSRSKTVTASQSAEWCRRLELIGFLATVVFGSPVVVFGCVMRKPRFHISRSQHPRQICKLFITSESEQQWPVSAKRGKRGARQTGDRLKGSRRNFSVVAQQRLSQHASLKTAFFQNSKSLSAPGNPLPEFGAFDAKSNDGLATIVISSFNR